MEIQYITANWPAPKNINAVVTLRSVGFSKKEYASLNLAKHTEDDITNVLANRKLVQDYFELKQQPYWLNQVHGNNVIVADLNNLEPDADAVITKQPQIACAVMSADCLSVFFCDTQGTQVAVAHAGWRSLANNILENTIKAMNLAAHNIMAWFGPAIGMQHFKVDLDVCNKLIQDNSDWQCFQNAGDAKQLCNLYQLAKNRLKNIGIDKIYGSENCTYSQQELFYSYRRDGIKTGRMASLIWLE